jgi:hypothetical protein
LRLSNTIEKAGRSTRTSSPALRKHELRQMRRQLELCWGVGSFAISQWGRLGSQNQK